MSRRTRFGILVTHPIQYFAPLYRQLAGDDSIDLTVYFAHRPTPAERGVGFGVAFEWDIDLTSDFPHHFLRNVSPRPDLISFRGCDTPEIGAIVQQERFDAFLVSGWSTRSYWQAMLACWRTGTSVMVRGDSQIDRSQPLLRRSLRRILYPVFMRRFATCLAVGERSEEYFRRHGARRIRRVPHFVDNEFFGRAVAERDRDEQRARFGIPADALVFLFVGKFVEKKRPMDLLRAAAQLGRKDVHLLFVGEGEQRSTLETAARDLGVSAHFSGFLNQTELPDAYSAADALVLPSDARETWGLVVNEAMASGLPVVVSDAAGCAPDLVLNGETGYRYPVGHIVALADSLKLLTDSTRRVRLAVGATSHIEAFSVSASAALLVEAARECTRKPR